MRPKQGETCVADFGPFVRRLSVRVRRTGGGRPPTDAGSHDLGAAPADVWKDLRSLTMPLHLVRGATSRVLSPEAADEMRARLPKARFHQIDGAGHFLMLAKPERLAEVIEETVLDIKPVGTRED